MLRRLGLITTVLLLGFTSTGLVIMLKAEAKEKYHGPRYEVVSVLGKNIELRRYAPCVVAQVEVQGEENAALNEGFRILAAYIFGKNKGQGKNGMNTSGVSESVKIPMTAPVTAQSSAEPAGSPASSSTGRKNLTVRFFMPANQTLSTLPEPQDQRVKLIELPEEKYAAIRFSGNWNPSNFKKQAGCLLECLSRKNIKPAGKPVNAYYDPPFTLPFLRHNELLVPLSNDTTAG